MPTRKRINPNSGRYYNMIVELKKLDKKQTHLDWSERSKEMEQDLNIHLLGEMVREKADKVSDIEYKMKEMEQTIDQLRDVIREKADKVYDEDDKMKAMKEKIKKLQTEMKHGQVGIFVNNNPTKIRPTETIEPPANGNIEDTIWPNSGSGDAPYMYK